MRLDNVKSLFQRGMSPQDMLTLTKPFSNTTYKHIKIKLSKAIVSYIAEPLAFAMNKCLTSRHFPYAVRPIYTAREAHTPENYRSISIPSGTSKLIELHMKNKIVDYFRLNNILTRKQHGFLAKRSTATAVRELIQKACESF